MSIRQNTYKYNASIIRVSKMNKWIYWVLLFGIAIGLFFIGIYHQYTFQIIQDCYQYALDGEIYISDCYPLIAWQWVCRGVFVGLFIALIFLTRKGWKERK